MYGIRGSPKKSDCRYINKIFDYGRKNAKEAMLTHGCDIEYYIRDILMKVGEIPRGDYRGLDEKVALPRNYKIMNINNDSKQEQHIAKMIENRGKANSSFEGENHFKFQQSKGFPNFNHNKSFMEESQFGMGDRSINSSNY